MYYKSCVKRLEAELCLLLLLSLVVVDSAELRLTWPSITAPPRLVHKHAVTRPSLVLFLFLSFSPCLSLIPSGKCYKQVVLTPMLEKRSHESVLAALPHTVALISMPSAANGQRGLSVAVLRDGSGSASVQVKE